MQNLTGTEKQIKWAEDIRAKALRAIDVHLAAVKADYDRVPEEQRLRVRIVTRVLEARAEAERQQTSAKWWIDSRMYEDPRLRLGINPPLVPSIGYSAYKLPAPIDDVVTVVDILLSNRKNPAKYIEQMRGQYDAGLGTPAQREAVRAWLAEMEEERPQ